MATAAEAKETPWTKRSKEQRRAIRDARSARVENLRAALALSFAGVVVRPADGTVTYQGQTYPLPATARVESQGELTRRITATRILMTGVFSLALKKKRDERELFLTVEGEGWGFVVNISPKMGMQARQFAASVNAARSSSLRDPE